MSQDYNHPPPPPPPHHHHHQGVFSFSNGFEHHQIRRDNKQQGFDDHPPLVLGIEEIESTGAVSVPGGYENAGMLSEMFNFTSPGAHMFNPPHPPAGRTVVVEEEEEEDTTGWYGNNRQGGGGVVVGGLQQRALDNNNNSKNLGNHQQISGINAAMQLFVMNPQPRSPSPSPSSSSTLHMLLPSSSSSPALHQGFHPPPNYHHSHFNPSGGQEGLSLSLSSSLQAAHQEEFRSMGESGILFFNQGVVGSSTSSSQYPSYSNSNNKTPHHQGGYGGSSSSSMGMVNVLRNSKYSKAAQELLEEFCSVGRGHHHHLKKTKLPNINNSSTAVVANSSSSTTTTTSKDLPPLSTADRLEYQRRKVKFCSMLDEARILSLSLSLHHQSLLFSIN